MSYRNLPSVTRPTSAFHVWAWERGYPQSSVYFPSTQNPPLKLTEGCYELGPSNLRGFICGCCGGFVPGGFVPGGFVLGGFVLGIQLPHVATIMKRNIALEHTVFVVTLSGSTLQTRSSH